MATGKKGRRIIPSELLEMLDLVERQSLASEIGLTLPKSLNDEAFAKSIAEFSATTLLQVIVRLKSPIIEMLKEVYHFLEQEEVRGRTTVRAILLLGAKDDLQILFNPAMKEAIATALDRKAISASIDSLEERTRELKELIFKFINDIRGTFVRSQTEISRFMRFDPVKRTIAHHFDKRRNVYHFHDRKLLLEYYHDFEEFTEKFDAIVHESGENDWFSVQIGGTVLEELQETMNFVRVKLQDMQRGRPGTDDIDSPRTKIDEDEWQDLLEKTQVLKEEILAACTFETKASLIYDFLNLELWRERWRIYELWMLIHLIRLFQGIGFTLDMHERVSDGLWNLKFTKDKKPVAILRGQGVNLEVYYQLYSKEGEGGNMPDLAIKEENGKYLIVLDPKYGESYRREELGQVGLRYANSKKFSPQLTVIHNFYVMPSYTFEVIQDSPRCLLVSNVRPDTTTTKAIDDEIIALVPHDWLPAKKSVIFLVDISGSIQEVRERIVQTVEKEFQSLCSVALANAILLLFSDKVDKEIPFSEIQSIREALNVSGGGTDLARGLEIALEMMKGMPAPRTLLFFTDGQDSLDSDALSQKMRLAEVQLKIYEAVDSDKPTLLQELVRLSGGEYQRI